MENSSINYEDYLKGNTEESKIETSDYPAPETAVLPAPGDKIIAYMRSQFKSQTPYFEPGIRSSNKDLALRKSDGKNHETI
ncbi:MAG: hypothetical protein WC979_00900 [Candidatus Pacearchaeota archaeon]|jgi:hypothetical protein|nr:hypothetical protein [Clostridia bacterium]